jgi:membrane protein
VTAGKLRRLEGLGPVEPVVRFGRDWFARFLSVQGIDRAMSIAAYGYSALIPLLIVYASLLPHETSFADSIVRRFDLSGASADSVQQAFASNDTVTSSVSVLGVVLLVVSALSFSRSVQRMYEGVYRLPTLGFRNTKWALLWLAVICLFAGIRPVILSGLSGHAETVATLALSGLLWLATPHLLLGRRLRWRRLAPSAVLCTIGMTGVGIWSVLFMPQVVASSSSEFGIIGIGFALLTWLVAVAIVLVVAASGGALIADRYDAHRRARAAQASQT